MTLFEQALAKLVKRANQRLVQMEKSCKTKEKAYQNIERDSYNYKKDIFSTRQRGGVKFRTDISKMTTSEKQSLYARVNKFLNKEYSTISSQKQHKQEIEENRSIGYEKILKIYPNLTKEMIEEVWSDSRLDEIKNQQNYASDSINASLNDAIGNGRSISQFLSRIDSMSTYEFEQWCNGKEDDTDDSDFITN